MHVEDNTHLTLQCLSLSLSPLKAFLKEVRTYPRKVSESTISIYRTQSTPRDIHWMPVATRLPRDISTIILNENKKQKILQDITDIADVQGFLLQYKREPEKACENVAGWVEEDLGVDDEQTTNTEEDRDK
ncbi:putative molybdopterin binding domain family protein [Aspergillus niger]|uniref:Putative molybdopterin binding domain family protein n=1 Tax=Aspergillus niger TaxID=5061 RepID=A0A505IJN7_ASPNG|nr:putative molybdopterin binding domain family protein [Aspergillus niger]